MHLVFCYFFASFNLNAYSRFKPFTVFKLVKLIGLNLLIAIVFMVLMMFSQRLIFDNAGELYLYRAGFAFRYVMSIGLIFILLNILTLYRNQRLRELDNQRLKTIYADAQLSNLQAQLNPHFLFNSLSSLSALITESTDRAQEYLGSLSQVLRYTLTNKKEQLVNLEEELKFLKKNIELLRIKYEHNLRIDLELEAAKGKRLPIMSLQLLLENALKHNVVSAQKPLHIRLTTDGKVLEFINNLNPIVFKEPTTGIGLANLQERYELLANKDVYIQKTETHFTVILPLI